MITALSRRSSFVAAQRNGAIRATALATLAVATLVLVTLALRLHQIHQSLFGDEIYTYQDIKGRGLSAVISAVHTGQENSPPLFFILAWAAAKVGDPTVWIRLPSIILSAATLPIAYLIGRETIGRVPGLLAAAILAFSPFMMFYGVEARPYATMVFFVSCSTLAVLRATKTQSAGWWMTYAVAATASAYSHYTCIFVLGVQACWSLWVQRTRPFPALIANSAIALLYLPWLPYLRGKSLGAFAYWQPFTASHVLTDIGRIPSGYPFAALGAIPTLFGLIAIGACVLVGLTWWGAAQLAHRPTAPVRDQRPMLTLLTALALASPVGLLLYSAAFHDLWLARNLSASLPAVVLVLAWALTRPPTVIAVVTSGVATAAFVLGTVRATEERYVRPQYRAIATALDREADSSAPIFYLSIGGQPAITAQLRKPHLEVANVQRLAGTMKPNTHVYVVLDDSMRDALHIRSTSLVPGLRLLSDKHYGGMAPTELLTFAIR